MDRARSCEEQRICGVGALGLNFPYVTLYEQESAVPNFDNRPLFRIPIPAFHDQSTPW